MPEYGFPKRCTAECGADSSQREKFYQAETTLLAGGNEHSTAILDCGGKSDATPLWGGLSNCGHVTPPESAVAARALPAQSKYATGLAER